MADTFQDISWGIIHGFRDAVLGSVKAFKLDAEPTSPVQKKDEPMTTLARRRAEKQKTNKKGQPKQSEPKVMNRILVCCAWNGGVFWLSIILFNYVLLPGLQWMTTTLLSGSSETNLIWEWIGPMLSWTFSALWILPLFVLSKIVNCFWFADIADVAYRKSRGRPQLLNISVFIADMLFSVLLQAFFLIQGTVAVFLPIPAIGEAVSLLHMSLLYSLYTFEYKWINMGWELHRRLSHIEGSWPYFLGFGLPMAILTALPSSFVVSGCVFSILFPLFIISANEANDMQRTFQYPLKLFAPVTAFTNTLFHHSFLKHSQAKQMQPEVEKQAHTRENVTFR